MTAAEYARQFGISAPLHLALLAGVVYVLLRCRDRRTTILATTGLLILLLSSLSWSVRFVLRDLGALSTPEGYSAVGRVSEIAYRYGTALGFLLLIVAGLARRPVTAPRSP